MSLLPIWFSLCQSTDIANGLGICPAIFTSFKSLLSIGVTGNEEGGVASGRVGATLIQTGGGLRVRFGALEELRLRRFRVLLFAAPSLQR